MNIKNLFFISFLLVASSAQAGMYPPHFPTPGAVYPVQQNILIANDILMLLRQNTYHGVTPQGRWCQLTVANIGGSVLPSIVMNGIEELVWSGGVNPSIRRITGFFSMSAMNTSRVLNYRNTPHALQLVVRSTEQIGNVHFLTEWTGELTVLKNRAGFPTATLIRETKKDLYSNEVTYREFACGQPGGY